MVELRNARLDGNLQKYEKQTFSLRVIMGTKAAYVVERNADNLEERTGCRFSHRSGPILGYYLIGTNESNSTITLDGTPATILAGLDLVEKFLKNKKLALLPTPSLGTSDYRASLKITSPNLALLRGVIETHVQFGYDFKNNTMYFVRSPEELKAILGDLCAREMESAQEAAYELKTSTLIRRMPTVPLDVPRKICYLVKTPRYYRL